jgi:hypothetical protein
LAAPVTPSALYGALLSTAISDSQLPHGYKQASNVRGSETAGALKYHAVGEVEINLDQGQEAILYAVFPTHQDAVGRFQHPDPSTGVDTRHAGPSSLPKPSETLDGYVTGKDAAGATVKNGITGVAFVDGNVIIGTDTISTHSTTGGDLPGAIALAKFAIMHLHAISG